MSEHLGQDDGPPAGNIRETTRLQRRLSALEGRQRQPEPISVLRLLNTDELRQALALVERAGVQPDGGVRYPEAFREATPQEQEALEHWKQLYGEPLDHLELAEELLDRVGEASGWRSPEAMETALLLERLKLPNESPWFVGKMAEAVVFLYAEMEEHGAGRGGAALHPHVRGAVRRLERLKEMDRSAPEEQTEAVEAPQRPEEEGPPETRSGAEDSHGTPEPRPAEEQPRRRRSWWREYFGFD